MNPDHDYGQSPAMEDQAVAQAARDAEVLRRQAEKDRAAGKTIFGSRAEAHRYLAGQMRGSGKLSRKAKRRLAVAMVKRAVRAQKRQA